MRPVISYDDITLPYRPAPSDSEAPSPRPPSKKRKTSNPNRKHTVQHQDGSLCPEERGGAPASTAEENGGGQNQESRELTYNEIWDDSALIDAWNAATEEYEAYNGPHQSWKTQPVNKSPLWYNKPCSLPTTSISSSMPVDGVVNDAEVDSDSRPLNFDTFVPTHDPTLDLPASPHPQSLPGGDNFAFQLPDPPGAMVNQDEAFTRALGAMYWTGYWTAVYHCQRNIGQNPHVEDNEGDVCEDEKVKDESESEGDEGLLVPTQR